MYYVSSTFESFFKERGVQIAERIFDDVTFIFLKVCMHAKVYTTIYKGVMSMYYPRYIHFKYNIQMDDNLGK